MSVESTRKVIEPYFNSDHSDTSTMADDVVFTDMGSGQEYVGPEAVQGMLDWFYHVAFDATAEPTKIFIGDGYAVFEGVVKGKHIGEFAGVPATNKEFSAPLCVTYDVEGDQIKRGRIYFSALTVLGQVGALGG